MRNMIRDEVLEMLQQGQQAHPMLITEEHLTGLPEPIQRYLRYAGIVGKETIRTVHLKQRGFYSRKPAQKWIPMEAEQYFTTNPSAFLWDMKSQPFPLSSLLVTDQFSNGCGNLRVKLWSSITVANARGPEINQGELQRYLLEMGWFPTAWLSDTIEWQAIDANSARASICDQGLTASGVLYVNEQGQLTRVTAQRYWAEKGHYRLEPWSAYSSNYREVNGIKIPTSFEVTWHFASGDFTWLRGNLTEIKYNEKEG